MWAGGPAPMAAGVVVMPSMRPDAVYGLRGKAGWQLIHHDFAAAPERTPPHVMLQDLSASIRQLKQIEEERVRIPEDERPPKAEVPRSVCVPAPPLQHLCP